jgi:type II restriction enzyme
MEDLEKLINDCQTSDGFFFKYISANDTGTTGAHQAGFYMPKNIWPLFFVKPGQKGENKDSWVKVRWSNGIETDSRFIWYGKGTRSEYRLTNGFTFLDDDNVGDILVLIKKEDNYFNAYLLNKEEEIDSFLGAFNLSPNDAYKLQQPAEKYESNLNDLFIKWIATLKIDFPESKIISAKAREFANSLINRNNLNYDNVLLSWIDTEYSLFKYIENDRYKEYILKPFDSVESLVMTANSILNRRKSRAGHSLENHLSFIFDENKIPYSAQAVTEQNKKPDFIFPDIELYRKILFPGNEMTFLAVKTTCKDRWRQILNEADKIEIKYLFTLQQGISSKQLEEMYKYNVRLVVPEKYRKDYPRNFISQIINLHDYVDYLKQKHV